jgi:hypothetical protein
MRKNNKMRIAAKDTDYLEQVGKKSTDQEGKIMNDQMENGMRGSMGSTMPIERSQLRSIPSWTAPVKTAP